MGRHNYKSKKAYQKRRKLAKLLKKKECCSNSCKDYSKEKTVDVDDFSTSKHELKQVPSSSTSKQLNKDKEQLKKVPTNQQIWDYEKDPLYKNMLKYRCLQRRVKKIETSM